LVPLLAVPCRCAWLLFSPCLGFLSGRLRLPVALAPLGRVLFCPFRFRGCSRMRFRASPLFSLPGFFLSLAADLAAATGWPHACVMLLWPFPCPRCSLGSPRSLGFLLLWPRLLPFVPDWRALAADCRLPSKGSGSLLHWGVLLFSFCPAAVTQGGHEHGSVQAG
jgi:hypothetical protein